MGCTAIQKRGTHDFTEVLFCGFDVLLTFIALFDDVASDPQPRMGDHDAIVVLVHVEGRNLLVHEIEDCGEKLHPVCLHVCLDVLHHLRAVRNMLYHAIEVALSLVGGAVWGAFDEVCVVLDVVAKTPFHVRVVFHVVFRDVVNLLSVLVRVNHGLCVLFYKSPGWDAVNIPFIYVSIFPKKEKVIIKKVGIGEGMFLFSMYFH